MNIKTAKLFQNGQSQAVRLPKEFRFEGSDLRALRAFREDYPEASACLLYLGKDRLAINGIPCLPCEDFLKDLHPDRAQLPQ